MFQSGMSAVSDSAARQQHDKKHDENQSEQTRRGIPPRAAVRPGGNGAYNRKHNKNEQHCGKHENLHNLGKARAFSCRSNSRVRDWFAGLMAKPQRAFSASAVDAHWRGLRITRITNVGICHRRQRIVAGVSPWRRRGVRRGNVRTRRRGRRLARGQDVRTRRRFGRRRLWNLLRHRNALKQNRPLSGIFNETGQTYVRRRGSCRPSGTERQRPR